MQKVTTRLLAEKLGIKELLEPDIQAIIEDKNQWPKDLHTVAQVAMGELERLGTNKQVSRQIVEALLVAMAFRVGGKQFYFPKGRQLKGAIRKYWIYKDSKSLSVRELAKKYQMTEAAIYDAIKQQKAIEKTADEID
ncbi:hypothetical protein NX722_25310 [Endozoicomonas gorgoniicola]|uniref:Mor transcription activator domain-containing protein n=1 Tax=Endozoicomonas gorgoniicola TaxID=1234144 RepID=A0ABT3N2N8_9GAMM|nr:Mor transcription activator family protein [Endozoicomonas gorgoniicola]MCW7555886.1 hypothetical protein [Endozoicomonas gorgoniicola]